MEVKDMLSKNAKRNPFKVSKKSQIPSLMDVLKKLTKKSDAQEKPADKAE